MIGQLLYTFPPEHKTESGQLFWSGLKRLPQIIYFNPEDETHVDFIFSTANLFAYIFNLPPITDRAAAAKIASGLKCKEFEAKKIVIAKENETEIKEDKGDDDEIRVAELTQLLSSKTINPHSPRLTI